MYQIYEDLITSVDRSEVGVVLLKRIKESEQKRKSNYSRVLSERLNCMRQVIRYKFNPTELLLAFLGKSTESRNPFGQVSLEPYFRYIEKNGKPDVCVADYPQFIELARYNNANNIATIYCTQNIESFTYVVHQLDDSTARIHGAIQWLAEMEMLTLSQERLMISLSETRLIRGLGLSAIHYPYFPVNEIRSRSMQIRQERANGPLEKGLFLMIGSIPHKPTGESFRWFLRNVKENGLPAGVRLVVGGAGGNDLMKEFGGMPGVEIRDHLEQVELDELIKKACAMLIPQQSGFGSVTRASEMSCAGIPVIASEHVLAAIQAPPGVHIVADDWSAWVLAMQNILEHKKMNTMNEYENWEESQPKPLKNVIEKYLE